MSDTRRSLCLPRNCATDLEQNLHRVLETSSSSSWLLDLLKKPCQRLEIKFRRSRTCRKVELVIRRRSWKEDNDEDVEAVVESWSFIKESFPVSSAASSVVREVALGITWGGLCGIELLIFHY